MKDLHTETSFTASSTDNGSHKTGSRKQLKPNTVSFDPSANHEAGAAPVEVDDTEFDTTDEASPAEDYSEEVEAVLAFLQEHQQLTEHNFIDTEEADLPYDDSSNWIDEEEEDPLLVYDVPRPALTINEVASILGKSVRAVERSISGKWGNRLPEGWKARKMKIDGQDEWRIIPPPSFRIRHSNKVRTPGTQVMTSQTAPRVEQPKPAPPQKEAEPKLKDTAERLLGFSLNSLIQTAGKKAKTELVKAAEYALDNSMMEHPTIVIDRSDEVERLLRQLSEVQRELAEERKMHLEDLRLLADMQTSMRLLEVKTSQTSTLKEELSTATQALQEHRRQYQEFLNLPWWKRLFKKAP